MLHDVKRQAVALLSVLLKLINDPFIAMLIGPRSLGAFFKRVAWGIFQETGCTPRRQ